MFALAPDCTWIVATYRRAVSNRGHTNVDVRIRILLRLIEERAGVLEMSSNQLGSLLGLSEVRVLRLFSSEVGKSLRSHVREVRMARAAEWLKDGVTPIKAIASRCGYSVASNFHRDFKIVHGISPMQMRINYLDTCCDRRELRRGTSSFDRSRIVELRRA
jgi:AraC-like DNA-binding protein